MKTFAITYSITYFIVWIIVAVILGLVSKHINESKGYYGGFAWGFWLGVIGIIVVAVRPENHSSNYHANNNNYNNSNNSALSAANEVERKKVLESGGWECRECHRLNANYVTTCLCGMPLHENNKQLHENNKQYEQDEEIEELIKLKKLLDNGIISEEEFAQKKKEILGL